MESIRVTPSNAHQMIGRQVLFKTRGQKMLCTVLHVSPSGNTLYINHPDLKNNIECIKRRVFAV